MIQIDSSNEPNYLSSDTVTDALERISGRASHDIEKAEELWRNKEVTDELYDSHHGKCCYCERKRDRKSEMDVEHYRPKGAVKDEETHAGYWWLVYEWNNLLWSCKTCNQKYKGTIFTLLPDATRIYDEAGDLDLESPCLINPKSEDPLQFLSFHVDRGGGRCYVTAVPRAGIEDDMKMRANETIRIAGLNRNKPGYDLIKERGDEFLGTEFEMIVLNIIQFEDLKNKVPEKRWEYLDAINDLREDLKMYICSDRIFAGVYRDYLRQFNIEYESLI